MSEPIQRVQFRAFPDGEVIALLPDQEANPGRVMSYLHIGQHGEASANIAASTRAATPEEYASLLRELESIGYRLRVVRRIQREDFQWRRPRGPGGRFACGDQHIG